MLTRFDNIQFLDGDAILWELRSDLDTGFYPDFIMGFIYGALYGRECTAKAQYNFRLLGPLDAFAVRYFNDLGASRFYSYFIQTEYLQLVNNALTIHKARQGHYIMWLRYPVPLAEPLASSMIFSTSEFIQGLLTGLNSFNIDPDEVLLAKPYKDGIFYDIQGMNLPYPEVYFDANFINPDELEEEDDED